MSDASRHRTTLADVLQRDEDRGRLDPERPLVWL